MHPREGRTRPNVMGACGMPSNGGETIQLYGRGFVRSRGPVAHFGLNQGSTRRFATLCTLFAPRICPTLPASQHPCCLLQLRLTTASASACFPLCRRSTHPRTFYVALVTGRRRTVSNEAPRGLLGRTPQQDTLCLTNEPPSAKGKRGGSSRPMVAPASLGTVR